MASRVNRGEVWMHEFRKPDKRRPVVVLSRQEVIPMLGTVIVAPITSTIHGVPSEVRVGVEEGLKRESAVNLDHVQTVERSHLRGYIGALDDRKMRLVCAALAVATACD